MSGNSNWSLKDRELKLVLKNLYFKEMLYAAFVKGQGYLCINVILKKEEERLPHGFDYNITNQLCTLLFREAKTICDALRDNVDDFLSICNNFVPEKSLLEVDIRKILFTSWKSKIDEYINVGASKTRVIQQIIKQEKEATKKRTGSSNLKHIPEERYILLLDEIWQEAMYEIAQPPIMTVKE